MADKKEINFYFIKPVVMPVVPLITKVSLAYQGQAVEIEVKDLPSVIRQLQKYIEGP